MVDGDLLAFRRSVSLPILSLLYLTLPTYPWGSAIVDFFVHVLGIFLRGTLVSFFVLSIGNFGTPNIPFI